MKRYKYQGLLTLLTEPGAGPEAALPGPTCRAVVRARHHDTQRSKLFSALVSTGDDRSVPGTPRVVVTVVLVGDDAADYLAPGEHFEVCRGGDVGRGVVTRRIFV